MDRLFIGDALEALKQIPSETVDTCVTSPPYYGLRDYGADGQIGLEKTPDEYIDRLVDVFHEVKRTLKKDGTLWIVISDSYAGSGKGAANYPDNAKKYKQGTNRGMLGASATTKIKTPGVKAKDLIGIPWMLAFALRADGWYLRSDIIWHKPNVMPESVKDRCTRTYEHVFMLAKSRRYYYDADAVLVPAHYDGRTETLNKQLRQNASTYELLFSAKGYDEMDIALEKADLKETFPSDFSRERICIYDNQGNQFLSVFYHIRNAFAHCRLNMVDVDGECVLILEDVQPKKNSNRLKVSARMILRKNTLIKWIDLIENRASFRRGRGFSR